MSIWDDSVVTTDPRYKSFKATPLYTDILTPTSSVSFSYARKLSDIEAKHAVIMHHNGSSWTPLETNWDRQEKTISVEITELGIYAVFLNEFWYSSYTQHMASEFPLWTKIRQDKESNGQQFLNVLGMTLEELEEYFTLIQEQKYIHRASIHMHDWVYVYELPMSIQDQQELLFQNGTDSVPVIPTLSQFFTNPVQEGGIMDYEKKRFYALRKYEALTVTIPLHNQTLNLTPIPHPIWNTFDEFGLLVGLRRKILETNDVFKERILDVFRYPSNTGRLGLIHGIARELDLVQRISWLDDQDFEWVGKDIETATLRVDGLPLEENMWSQQKDEHGVQTIRIYAWGEGKKRTISFIQSIRLYQLYDRKDQELYRLMFDEEGRAQPRLEKWVEYINQVAPVMWGKFNWDEGYWNTIDKQLHGVGYIPNLWDSNVSIWREYEIPVKLLHAEKIWK